MDRRALGWTGEKISPLILGSWEYGNQSMVEEERAISVISKAVELGINAIDTAESYGESERIVGKAIKRFKRDEVFIITKVSPEHLRYDDVLRAAEGSLKRLDTTHIDLYLVHWPNAYVPLRETMKAMERLYSEGKIRYIGLSNFPLPLLRDAREHLSKTDVAANELHYNLLFREVEKEVMPYMVAEDIPLLAYDPLGLGFLLGRKESRREYQWYILARQGSVSGLDSLVEELREVARAREKTVAQVALNWLLMKKGVFPIFNTGKIEHLEEDLGSLGWELTLNDLRRIDEAVSKVKFNYV
jgi:myo-inositol catabolism protein IolS